ncbi:NrfD/PsrC family molybdoenzyme membrane anchor subunit [Acidianus manzaensis]|uniref:Sulfur reduction protein DsrP n=1 Tax=Acidianus manzaensis TaxID=282676 RepID=A0A1W6JYH6_9CREN|nr:NrfD/PsrC family molybdoenzyme membrane anchor subunit [Acidianus manzaensis]ARM75326.1 sulfur reduction protein DsrP [Acidianus manzaensis]
MNKILLAWTIVFILIGGGILFYGMSFNPIGWFNGKVTFTEPNNAPIPWGLLVIGYMFFGIIGTGVSSYNSLYEIFNKNHKEDNPFHKISLRNEWLALAVLIPGWIMVFASTYKPGEAMYIYLSFRDTSRIAWNGVLYALVGIGIIAEILALIGEKIKLENKKDPLSRFLGWLSSELKIEIPGMLKIVVSIIAVIVGYAIVAEVILDANLGSVFGYLSTWVDEFGPFMSILLVILSFYAGISMISFVSVIYGKMSKKEKVEAKDPPENMYKVLGRDGVLATIAIGFLMLWWIWLTATNQETSPWASLLLTGVYSIPFWIGIVLSGIIIPLALYSIAYAKRNAKALFASSIFSLLGMFSIITLADILPQSITWYYTISPISPSNSNWVYELRSVFNHGPLWTLLPFNISFYDIVWFTGSVLLLLGFYTLGVLILPLEEEEKPKHIWIFK